MDPSSLSAAESRLWRRARQFLDSRQLVAAQAALESLVQRLPRAPVFRMELAGVLLERGHVQAATAHWLRAAAAPLPDDPGLVLNLAQALARVGEVLAAHDCLDHLARLADVPAPLWAEQAQLRFALGDLSAARNAITRALEAGIDTPDEHYLHASLCQFSGDLARAESVLQDCVRRWPFFGGAVMALANLRRQTPSSNHLDFLQRQLQRFPAGNATPAENLVRAEFESALFKELDDLGRHEEAWAALASSNALMHALNPYNRALEEAVTDALIRHSGRGLAPTPLATRAPDGPVPIFIVGMPRSGTTLLDRMLSNHPEVVSLGETNDFLRQLHGITNVAPGGMLQAIERSADIDYAELGARYLRQTQWRAPGYRYFIDKLPANIQMVGIIRRALPQALILHMVRDPMDVCFSNFRAMFGNASAYSYDLPALVHYYRQYERLAAHWRATLAETWLEVSYADLVRAPETSLRRVLDYGRLDFQEACLRPERNAAPVTTPSNVQVREPIHVRSLGQWRNYREPLEPLRRMLESDAREIGVAS